MKRVFFKYLIPIVFLLISCLFVRRVFVIAEAIFGDVNSDGLVNRTDVILILKHVIGSSELDPSVIESVDITGDGLVRINDITKIMKQAVYLDTEDRNVYVGNSLTIHASGYGDITWTSTDPTVATVSDSGVLNALKVGTTTVKATSSNGKKASVKINVTGERIHFISGTSEDTTNGSSGDAILIESKGHYAMVDTGYNGTYWTAVNKYLKNQNVDTLSFILLTHMHGDHVANLGAILNRYTVKNIYMKKYCADGNNDSKYDDLYDCTGITIADEDTCALVDEDNVTHSRQSARYYTKVMCWIDRYNRSHEGNEINVAYVNNKTFINNGNFYDKTFSTLNFKMSLYQQPLIPASTLDGSGGSENLNSLIALFESQNGKATVLTGDAYDTAALNESVASIREKIGTDTIDVLKVPHHGSRYCAMLTKDGVSTTLKSNVTAYVITSSTARINWVKQEYPGQEVCVDVFSKPVSSNKYWVDECIYDSTTNTFNTGAVIADFTTGFEMSKTGTIAGCSVGSINS